MNREKRGGRRKNDLPIQTNLKTPTKCKAIHSRNNRFLSRPPTDTRKPRGRMTEELWWTGRGSDLSLLDEILTGAESGWTGACYDCHACVLR